MVKQIRILHYIGSLEMGGSQTLIMEIYRNLNRQKIQFDFIVDKKDKLIYGKEIESLGGKIYFLPNYTGKNHFSYKKAWNDFFLEHKEYKVIHSHVRSTASIVLKIAKKYGLVTISHSHNTSNGTGISALIKKTFQFRIRYVADYFMGCSYEANKWLFGKKNANSSQCIILNNGINTEKFSFNKKIREKIRKELGLNNELLIGHVGRFCYQKNHEFLLEIFKIIHQKDKNAKLLLIGDGEDKEKIVEKIKQYNLEDFVIILSNCNNVNELMNAMDYFVFPSRYEGLGIVVIEAQSTGLKCLISDNVPKSVIVTDIVSIMNLDYAEKWADLILKDNHSTINRSSYNLIVEKSGYSINNTVNYLTEFYLKIIT